MERGMQCTDRLGQGLRIERFQEDLLPRSNQAIAQHLGTAGGINNFQLWKVLTRLGCEHQAIVTNPEVQIGYQN